MKKLFFITIFMLASVCIFGQADSNMVEIQGKATLADTDVFIVSGSDTIYWKITYAQLKTLLAAIHQPLEATLTDIADGTIAENLVNTANPWADNEVANDITITNISQVGDITATVSEINTPLDGALVTLTEFKELETIGATTLSAAQWTGLGGSTTAGIALWDDANNVAQLVTLGLTATATEINTPLDGASVTLTEFQELETIGASTISANQWAALGGIAETLTSTELNYLDGVTSTVLETMTWNWAVLDTVVTGDLPGWKVPFALTITDISSYTDANTTTFNIEERVEATPNTAGTDAIGSDLVADNNQQETQSFTNADFAADTWMVPTISATGDVAIFSITITYTKQ